MRDFTVNEWAVIRECVEAFKLSVDDDPDEYALGAGLKLGVIVEKFGVLPEPVGIFL